MRVIDIETRLRKIETRRARVAEPVLAKHQRNADTAAAVALPGAEARALAVLVTERNASIRERNAATIAAFWRTDT